MAVEGYFLLPCSAAFLVTAIHPSLPHDLPPPTRLIGHKNDFGFLSSNAYNNCRNNVVNLSVGAEVEEQNAPSKVPEMFPGRQKRL